jgi:hypothetical protein
MGNGQSIENKERMNQIVNEIKKFDCCTLDIGDMKGETDYIDFITDDILEGHDVMKGVDIYGRFFIIVKAHIVYSNRLPINTFTTFFQRYTDNNIRWVGCGHKAIHLMDTSGGMTLVQLELLRDLLYNNSVKFDNSIDTRVFIADFYKEDIIDIKIGYKNDSLSLQDTNCMINQATIIIKPQNRDEPEFHNEIKNECITKPVLERQTNIASSFDSKLNTRLWETTLEDIDYHDIENDRLFKFTTPRDERGHCRSESF